MRITLRHLYAWAMAQARENTTAPARRGHTRAAAERTIVSTVQGYGNYPTAVAALGYRLALFHVAIEELEKNPLLAHDSLSKDALGLRRLLADLQSDAAGMERSLRAYGVTEVAWGQAPPVQNGTPIRAGGAI